MKAQNGTGLIFHFKTIGVIITLRVMGNGLNRRDELANLNNTNLRLLNNGVHGERQRVGRTTTTTNVDLRRLARLLRQGLIVKGSMTLSLTPTIDNNGHANNRITRVSGVRQTLRASKRFAIRSLSRHTNHLPSNKIIKTGGATKVRRTNVRPIHNNVRRLLNHRYLTTTMPTSRTVVVMKGGTMCLVSTLTLERLKSNTNTKGVSRLFTLQIVFNNIRRIFNTTRVSNSRLFAVVQISHRRTHTISTSDLSTQLRSGRFLTILNATRIALGGFSNLQRGFCDKITLRRGDTRNVATLRGLYTSVDTRGSNDANSGVSDFRDYVLHFPMKYFLFQYFWKCATGVGL